MITGELPWRSFTDKKAIECQKFRFPPSLLVDKVVQLGGPAELHSFVAELGRLDFFTSPNYRRLRGIFRCFLIRRGVKSTDPYDWVRFTDKKDKATSVDVSSSLQEVQGPSPPQRHGTEGFRPSHNVSGCPARYSCLGANGSLLASRINIRPRR